MSELTKIFEILGNQQEMKKVFTELDKYLKDLEIGYSIWSQDEFKELDLIWYKDDIRTKKIILNSKNSMKPYTNRKQLVFDKENTAFHALIPIISREENKGFLCIHDDLEMGELWKKIYVVTTLLTFVLRYYEMIQSSGKMKTTDMTTGLYNARHFNLQIGLEVEKSKRFNSPLSILTIKIKDFQMINKKLGFDGGEEVLKNFAAILQNSSRKTDMPSRINDDQFAILLYQTDKKGAKILAERLKNRLESKKIQVLDYEINLEIEYNAVEYKKDMSVEGFLEKAKEMKE